MKSLYSSYLKRESSWTHFLNLCSGLLLKIFRPFNKSDIIEINGSLGTVIHKGAFVFQIKTFDNKIISFSNRRVYTQGVNNLTTKNMIRLDLNVEVPYDANMKNVRKVLMEVLKNNDLVLDSPSPKISIAKLNNKFIELTVSPWCEPDNYWSANNTLKKQLQESLMSNNIASKQAKPALIELRKVI